MSCDRPVQETEMEKNMEVEELKRIANALEEILRLVKKDMEPSVKKRSS